MPRWRGCYDPRMQVCLLKSKIHRASITDGKRKSLRDLRHPRRSRFGPDRLNGAAAFQGKRGDVLTIMSFAHVPKHKIRHWKPRVIVLGKRNRIVKERGI